MIYLALFILIPVIAFFLGSLLYIAKRYKGFVEEDYLGEVKLVSPAFKIVKNVMSKTLLSLEIVLTILTIYVLSFTTSYVATFSYTSQVIEFEPQYNLLLVRRGAAYEYEDIAMYIPRGTVAVVQIFNPVEIGNETYYALLLQCDVYANQSLDTSLLTILLKYCGLVENRIAVVDISSSMDQKTLRDLLGIEINLVKLSLGELMNIELAPGVYVVHSIGIVGGSSLRIEDARAIILLPFVRDIYSKLCRNNGCDSQVLVMAFDDLRELEVDEMLDIYDYAVIKKENMAVMVSRLYIPTTRTLIGMALSLAISMIIVYAIGGGFLEKIIGMYTTLHVIGITKEMYSSIVLLGTMLAMSLLSIPIVVLCGVGILNSLALINFLLSVIGFLVLMSKRLSHSISKGFPYGFVASYNYVVDAYAPPEKIVRCLSDFFEKDDFFYSRQARVIEEDGRWIIRLDLIYRRALSTLASAEIYIDSIGRGTKYTVNIDVWSMEDLPSKILESVQRLALSKVVGGVEVCTESL